VVSSLAVHTLIISPIRTLQLYQAESNLLDLMALVKSGAVYKLILPHPTLNLTKMKRNKEHRRFVA
jgi:hypothetical protein